MALVIEVQGLVNRLGRQVVHDGLDLEIRSGEIFCIFGGSGSGKSVLLRTMLGLQRPAAGSVRIEGREVVRQSAPELVGREDAPRGGDEHALWIDGVDRHPADAPGFGETEMLATSQPRKGFYDVRTNDG